MTKKTTPKTRPSVSFPPDETTPVDLPSDDKIIEAVGLNIEALFETFKSEDETEAKVKGPMNNRRSKKYEEQKKRAMRLAELLSSMTPMQQRFVTEYVKKDWDTLSEVAIRAGSTAKGESLRQISYTYLNREDIKEAIVLLTLRKLEAEGIDRYEVIGMLKDSFNGAMADGRYKEANEASQMLGTAIGMFSPSKNKGLTDMEQGQLRELNKVSKAANVAGDIKEGSVVNEATISTLDDELRKHIGIAGLKPN
jgi:phage terminase small subunit